MAEDLNRRVRRQQRNRVCQPVGKLHQHRAQIFVQLALQKRADIPRLILRQTAKRQRRHNRFIARLLPMRQILHPTTRHLNFRQPALQFLRKRRQKFARHQTVSPRQRLRQHPRNRAVARARLDKQRIARAIAQRCRRHRPPQHFGRRQDAAHIARIAGIAFQPSPCLVALLRNMAEQTGNKTGLHKHRRIQ